MPSFRRSRGGGRQRHETVSSDDEILRTYKFCNVFRELDRTTRWQREHLTRPHENAPVGLILFNVAAFRLIGTIEAGQCIGWIDDFDPDALVDLLDCRLDAGLPTYTTAYRTGQVGKNRRRSQFVSNPLNRAGFHVECYQRSSVFRSVVDPVGKQSAGDDLKRSLVLALEVMCPDDRSVFEIECG